MQEILIEEAGVLIQLNEEERKKVEEFADKVIVTDVYSFRNGQNDLIRRREQHISSKLAELSIPKFLASKGILSSEPDFEIYKRNKKSWAPDMVMSSGEPIHVKSQDVKSAEKYGLSWIGEKSDSELYEKATGYVALCLVAPEFNTVRILGFPKASFLKEWGLFGEPKLPKHREKKFAIYFDKFLEFSRTM